MFLKILTPREVSKFQATLMTLIPVAKFVKCTSQTCKKVYTLLTWGLVGLLEHQAVEGVVVVVAFSVSSSLKIDVAILIVSSATINRCNPNKS